jgi:hypothetical protein
MLEELIASAGVWYFAACAGVFAATFVEKAGAPRSPEEDHDRKRTIVLLHIFAPLLTYSLLLVHAWFLTTAMDSPRLLLVTAITAAVLLGSMLGAIFGAVARNAAPTMRKLALPLSLAALALTLFATWPSIVALVNGLQDGVLELPVRPI